MPPVPFPPASDGDLPLKNALIYSGFRIVRSVSDSGAPNGGKVVDWSLGGGVTSNSLTRWTFDGKTYEIFADVSFESYSSGKYYYSASYWSTEVKWDEAGRQGILPVAGAPKTKISFPGNYYSGGLALLGKNLYLPKTFTLSYSPQLLGWRKGAIVKGPGTRTSTPANNNDQTSDTTDPYNPDVQGGSGNKPADDHNSVKLKNYTLTMNPPPIRFATGAFVPMDTMPEDTGVSGIDSKEGGFRQAVLGRGTVSDRISRKGWIAQYVEWSGDWNTEAPSSDVSSKNPDAANWTKDSLMLDQGIRYGFRFHYNPGEIAFGMGEYQNINPAVIMSSKTSVMPITNPENPPSVTLNLLLNRTEDVGLISRKRLKGGKFSYFVNSGDTEGLNPYSKKYMTEEHLRGIATRGTMWDLEFLFRTGLGRPMPTTWRGKTADLGIFFGVPIILHLSDQMTYLGRMSSISYTHTSFTMDMVPILTSVSINVVRLPDGVATSFGKTKKPKNGKK